jgi:hypothetical protein
MSLYDVSRDHARQFSFNQLSYPSQRQALGNNQPVLTRWVIQAKSTLTQSIQQRQIATNVNAGKRNLITLSYGIGPGVGMSFPKSAPGTTTTVLPIGTDLFDLGASNRSQTGKELYTYSRAKANLGLPLPSALSSSILNAGGFTYTAGISSQESTNWQQFTHLNIIPGSTTSTNPLTSQQNQVNVSGKNEISSSVSVYLTSELTKPGDAAKNGRALIESAKAYREAQESIEGDIDPVAKVATAAVLIGTYDEVRARARKFKLEALRSLADLAKTALDSEAGSNAAYPALYLLAKESWLSDVTTSIFKQIAILEQSATYKELVGIANKVNKYLPQAQAVYNFIFPNKEPIISAAGVDVNLNSLKLQPSYQQQLENINRFLPQILWLKIDDRDRQLALGDLAVQREKGLEFDNTFRERVRQINLYLPTEFKFIYGINEKVLLVTPGIVISQNDGLLIADAALDISKLVESNLNCSNYLQPTAKVANGGLSVTSTTARVSNSVLNLQSNLLSTLAGTYDWDANPPKANPRGVANLAEKLLNTALPDNMPLKISTDKNGLKQIDLGLLQVKRTSATSWEFAVPSAYDLNSGLDIISTLSPTPPDLTFIKESIGKVTSFYQEHKQEFINFFGGKDVVGNLIRLPKSKLKLDFKTGIRLEGVFGGEDKEVSNYADLEDVETSTITGGYLDKAAVENFTQRPTFKGSLLPLLSYLDESFERQRTFGTLGRSDAGLSLETGKIANSRQNNYALLAALCAQTDRVKPQGETDPIGESTNASTGYDLVDENPAEPLTAEVVGTYDVQSTRDLLEVQLIELGIADRAGNLLDVLDDFLYPETYEYDDDDNVVLVTDNKDAVEKELDPLEPNSVTNFKDLLKVIETVGDLSVQQVIGGLGVSLNIDRPAAAVTRATAIRYRERLDCQSLNYYQANLESLTDVGSYRDFGSSYGIELEEALVYVNDPFKLLNILDNIELSLRPALERLLLGDLAGFFRQVIWAKSGVDIYYLPRQYVRLQANVRGYYGGAVSSSNPTRDWQDSLTF